MASQRGLGSVSADMTITVVAVSTQGHGSSRQLEQNVPLWERLWKVHGIALDAIWCGEPAVIDREGMRIVRLARGRGLPGRIRFVLRAGQLARARVIEHGDRAVLLGSDPLGWVVAAGVATLCRRRCRLEVHGDLLGRRPGQARSARDLTIAALLLVTARRADRVRVVSQRVAVRLRRRTGRRTVVEVFPSRLHPEFEAALGPVAPTAGRTAEVVAVGSLLPVKGFDLLLAAWASVGDPGVSLRLVGDGPERQRLEGLARGLPVGSVVFDGPVSAAQVARRMQEARLVVISSRHEGAPRVLMEALAAGTPLVATAVGGIPDLVDGSPSVCLVAPTADAIAAGITALLGDIDAAIEHAAGAAQASRQRFGFQAGVDRMVPFLTPGSTGRDDDHVEPERGDEPPHAGQA